VLTWQREGIAARGSDFSKQVIEIAKSNARAQGSDPEVFVARSIYDMTPDRDGADLIVCCEVLEHVERPHDALRALQSIATGYVIVSVPREPIWRALNLARGKYVGALGNTPGHIQHWSRHAFIALVSQYFEVVDVRSPLPWTLLLCRVRR
jgi:2-polyprenyl-3-methyl-5-hydroxy-6-metoxy-1,4-benzoquinol methylase